MAKVTSKYQVTVPKKIAEQFHIRPGDEIEWLAAGESIRVIPAGTQNNKEDRRGRLKWFDQATERHKKRSQAHATAPATEGSADRGWTREELYERGRTR